ncbi:hypothetical protein QT06_C0001G1229 [archaeon GW2011_AR15]|nr:hypothetical protein QT06_C0001G1229 [archaeon GW2011_AR15]
MDENLGMKIERLSRELERAQHERSLCNHVFGEPNRILTEYKVPYIVGYIPCGSDPIPDLKYETKTRIGWERMCLNDCGYREYTEALEVTQEKRYKPDFTKPIVRTGG